MEHFPRSLRSPAPHLHPPPPFPRGGKDETLLMHRRNRLHTGRHLSHLLLLKWLPDSGGGKTLPGAESPHSPGGVFHSFVFSDTKGLLTGRPILLKPHTFKDTLHGPRETKCSCLHGDAGNACKRCSTYIRPGVALRVYTWSQLSMDLQTVAAKTHDGPIFSTAASWSRLQDATVA